MINITEISEKNPNIKKEKVPKSSKPKKEKAQLLPSDVNNVQPITVQISETPIISNATIETLNNNDQLEITATPTIIEESVKVEKNEIVVAPKPKKEKVPKIPKETKLKKEKVPKISTATQINETSQLSTPTINQIADNINNNDQLEIAATPNIIEETVTIKNNEVVVAPKPKKEKAPKIPKEPKPKKEKVPKEPKPKKEKAQKVSITTQISEMPQTSILTPDLITDNAINNIEKQPNIVIEENKNIEKNEIVVEDKLPVEPKPKKEKLQKEPKPKKEKVPKEPKPKKEKVPKGKPSIITEINNIMSPLQPTNITENKLDGSNINNYDEIELDVSTIIFDDKQYLMDNDNNIYDYATNEKIGYYKDYTITFT
jgi:hypothetical protein